jgi:pimeloyl-ACP methyl ester carboxylesterase
LILAAKAPARVSGVFFFACNMDPIPHGEFMVLTAVSHFAPLQRPEQFNNAVLGFVRKIPTN